MKGNDWSASHRRVVALLKQRLGSAENCAQVIDGYEAVLASIWSFTARLLGEGGARAVMVRAGQLAARDVPMVQQVRVKENGVDFAEFRALAAAKNCSTHEVMDALTTLAAMIFRTLSELAGDILTEPLLQYLEHEER
ncbi:MAG: hypothetical protein HYY30_06025 [Chloroflexi bacterium]|nr:hypothetical protein [Chloroflexota bacterium]